MPDTSVTQAPRLIELIAWLSQGDSGATITYKAAARKFGVSEAQIRNDLDVLVHLSDEHKDFLANVRVAIVADGFTVVSRGPFRRPVQFSAEEGLALLLGLGAVQGGRGVAAKFRKGTETIESAYAIGSAPSADLDGVLAGAPTGPCPRRSRSVRRSRAGSRRSIRTGASRATGATSSRFRWLIPRGSCARCCSMGPRLRCSGPRGCGRR